MSIWKCLAVVSTLALCGPALAHGEKTHAQAAAAVIRVRFMVRSSLRGLTPRRSAGR